MRYVARRSLRKRRFFFLAQGLVIIRCSWVGRKSEDESLVPLKIDETNTPTAMHLCEQHQGVANSRQRQQHNSTEARLLSR